jgi:alkylresorcinol/alkylpyrone synthase
MYYRSLATAVPTRSWTQAECWEALRETESVRRLPGRAAGLLEKVLLGENGIERRHFALSPSAGLTELGAQELNEAYEREAAELGALALGRALREGGVSGVDALFVCSCTGSLCPGLGSHVAERVGLAESTHLADLTGAGCGGAVPALHLAAGYLALHPGHRAAVLAVEVCSAAFYLSADPGVLISLCLFGDGAAAMILDGADVQESGRRFSRFSGLHWPQHREKVRFVNRLGKLCNQLDRSVPEVAARAVGELYRQGEYAGHRVVCHAGGRDVLDAVEQELGRGTLLEAREVLRRHGNMSSPSVLFALEQALRAETDPAQYWLCTFGAGFAAHSCALEPVAAGATH